MTDMPKAEVVTSIERGPVSVVMGGVAYHFEHTVTSVDDWRDTPWGRVNFGRVYWGPWKRVLTALDSTPT